MLSRTVVSDAALLSVWSRAWEDLMQRSASDEPMLSPTWLFAWWRVFGGTGGRSLRVVLFQDGGRLVGLAPLCSRRTWYAPGVPFRRLETVGSGEEEQDEVCSEYLGVLAERGAEDAVAVGLAEVLLSGGLGRWDELLMPNMDGRSPIIGALAQALVRRGARTYVEPTGTAAHIPLPASWEAYLKALPSSSRYLVKRSLRELEQWAEGDIEIEHATDPASLEAGTAVLTSLHGERWGGRGAFASRRFRAFHDAVMPALLARGALELSWMKARGEPIAAIYNIVWRGRVYFYQAGRSLALPKGIRPGIVMHAHAIRRAIASGHSDYDFLAGGARYKRQLGLAERSMVTLRAARPGLREEARAWTARAIDGARALVRRPAPAAAGATAPTAASTAAPTDGAASDAVAGANAVVSGDLNLLRCFAGTEVRPLCISPDPQDLTFYSRHCAERRLIADASLDPESAARDLARLGKLLAGRPALFYGDDATLAVVSRHRAELSEGFRFLMPDAERVEELLDRARFAALARRLELPVPPTAISSEATSASLVLERLGLPLVLKPARRLGWRSHRAVEAGDAVLATSRRELEHALDRLRDTTPDFVVQEEVPGGQDLRYSFHAWFDARGRALGQFVGRKVRTYPRQRGVSTVLELVHDAEAQRVGLDVAQRLGIVGPVKIDLKRHAGTGRLVLLEVHPRFNLWHRLGAASGVNLPLIAWRDLSGTPPEPTASYRTGVRWVSFGDDARTFVRDYAPAGDLSWRQWLGSLTGPKLFDVFDWDDPSPLAVHLIRTARARAGLEGEGS